MLLPVWQKFPGHPLSWRNSLVITAAGTDMEMFVMPFVLGNSAHSFRTPDFSRATFDSRIGNKTYFVVCHATDTDIDGMGIALVAHIAAIMAGSCRVYAARIAAAAVGSVEIAADF